MAERRLLVSDLAIEYDGLFDSSDLFRFLDDWFQQKGYDKQEVRHAERVKEKGKFVDLEIMPTKKVSDYVKYDINVRVYIKDLVQANIKRDGKQFKINKGRVTILISAFLVTDYEHRMESKPMLFFMRTLFDKFVHKKYIDRFEKGMMNDVQQLHTELKSFLNLNRYVQPA